MPAPEPESGRKGAAAYAVTPQTEPDEFASGKRRKNAPLPRPSQGASQDEVEGLKQRLPGKAHPPGGVKDI